MRRWCVEVACGAASPTLLRLSSSVAATTTDASKQKLRRPRPTHPRTPVGWSAQAGLSATTGAASPVREVALRVTGSAPQTACAEGGATLRGVAPAVSRPSDVPAAKGGIDVNPLPTDARRRLTQSPGSGFAPIYASHSLEKAASSMATPAFLSPFPGETERWRRGALPRSGRTRETPTPAVPPKAPLKRPWVPYEEWKSRRREATRGAVEAAPPASPPRAHLDPVQLTGWTTCVASTSGPSDGQRTPHSPDSVAHGDHVQVAPCRPTPSAYALANGDAASRVAAEVPTQRVLGGHTGSRCRHVDPKLPPSQLFFFYPPEAQPKRDMQLFCSMMSMSPWLQPSHSASRGTRRLPCDAASWAQRALRLLDLRSSRRLWRATVSERVVLTPETVLAGLSERFPRVPIDVVGPLRDTAATAQTSWDFLVLHCQTPWGFSGEVTPTLPWLAAPPVFHVFCPEPLLAAAAPFHLGDSTTVRGATPLVPQLPEAYRMRWVATVHHIPGLPPPPLGPSESMSLQQYVDWLRAMGRQPEKHRDGAPHEAPPARCRGPSSAQRMDAGSFNFPLAAPPGASPPHPARVAVWVSQKTEIIVFGVHYAVESNSWSFWLPPTHFLLSEFGTAPLPEVPEKAVAHRARFVAHVWGCVHRLIESHTADVEPVVTPRPTATTSKGAGSRRKRKKTMAPSTLRPRVRLTMLYESSVDDGQAAVERCAHATSLSDATPPRSETAIARRDGATPLFGLSDGLCRSLSPHGKLWWRLPRRHLLRSAKWRSAPATMAEEMKYGLLYLYKA